MQPVHPDGVLGLVGIVWPKIVMFDVAAKTLVRGSFGVTALVIVEEPLPGAPVVFAHFTVIDKDACAGDPGTIFPVASLSQATTGPEIVTSVSPPLVQAVLGADGRRPTLILLDGMGPSVGTRF